MNKILKYWPLIIFSLTVLGAGAYKFIHLENEHNINATKIIVLQEEVVHLRQEIRDAQAISEGRYMRIDAKLDKIYEIISTTRVSRNEHERKAA